MIVTRTHSVISQVGAHDLTSLMDLYECNYMRLRKLIPDVGVLPVHSISRLVDGLDLHLTVLDPARYTTTVRLTYFFEEDGVCYPAPDVTIRIYHDAHLAEVMSCGRRRGHRPAEYNRQVQEYPLARKWEINRFLFKWLGYLLHQRHGFEPDRIITPTTDEFDTVLRLIEGMS